MAFGDALQKRMEELAKRQPMIEKRLAEIAEGATTLAMQEAINRTPPNTFEDGEIRGVHTITGEMAEHTETDSLWKVWEQSSQVAPTRTGGQFITTLANDKQYASYVNDGHDVDKHFVPGLYVDDEGVLSMDPARDVGLMVGTKTKYVPGLYMKEAGVDKYKEVAETELRKLTGEVFQ